MQQSKPISNVTSKVARLLKASATLFYCPDLCLSTNVNFDMKTIHRAWIWFKFLWALTNFKA
jgi:hypothetical protein